MPNKRVQLRRASTNNPKNKHSTRRTIDLKDVFRWSDKLTPHDQLFHFNHAISRIVLGPLIWRLAALFAIPCVIFPRRWNEDKEDISRRMKEAIWMVFLKAHFVEISSWDLTSLTIRIRSQFSRTIQLIIELKYEQNNKSTNWSIWSSMNSHNIGLLIQSGNKNFVLIVIALKL